LLGRSLQFRESTVETLVRLANELERTEQDWGGDSDDEDESFVKNVLCAKLSVDLMAAKWHVGSGSNKYVARPFRSQALPTNCVLVLTGTSSRLSRKRQPRRKEPRLG
jgi:hypothetical protein